MFPPAHPSLAGHEPFDSTMNGFISQAVASLTNNKCRRCQHVGCDLKVLDCGCLFHVRCIQIFENQPLTVCPGCHSAMRSLFLLPMDFNEIDQAKAAAAAMAPSSKRGKKRKNATIARLNPSNAMGDDGGDGSDLRTGRWTTEETHFCDQLIDKYEKGELPVSDGVKLNDFLANMLKSKQSRLTKKMKNAKLSAKTYKHSTGCISDDAEAKEFSQIEVDFYESIQCDLERAEIRFHMQKEWRELFSSYCVTMGQSLDADSWLSSVEELDRRVSQAKDAARMARRKVMMGHALSQDSMNPQRGVFIEQAISTDPNGSDIMSSTDAAMHTFANSHKRLRTGKERTLKDFSSPFVGKVIQYIQRHQLPFEHIDAWVPSFVSQGDDNKPSDGPSNGGVDQQCRLCFAGFASTEVQVPPDGSRPVSLTSQEQFDLLSFGEYSSKFSFDVGCGLPGRVYSTGICSWEQGVENAPRHQFERCGGAAQWGIKTVLGVPIPSPNVGRVVVLLYSRHDRARDPEMVRRVTEELTKLMPTPKWKLVVDVGSAPPTPDDAKGTDKRVQEVLKLLAEHTPTHRNSPYSPYLPGFTSLRLLLLKRNRTSHDDDLLSTMLESYSSYLGSGREPVEIAWMMARDYMLLTQPSNQMNGSSFVPLLQSFQPVQNPPQQQQQNLQLQIGNVQPSSAIPNQFQHQQLQQIEALHHAAQLQNGTSPVPLGAGLNPSFIGANSMSLLGHFAPNAGANGGANGLAALTHFARQHHSGLGNNSLFPSSTGHPKGQEK
ncbi:hypothetical protein IV203_009770 [Nitzschia inconspicua]|uniref:RING-type domain-containing protein n=1 Tax=Nitzschia inconspicua TaxID=303405 RepID=A0A9K3PK85_9STRA|nr:hypothetical protein IV203_009770 [Nitzschia inconspicua]